jgi:hypothetical protein
MGNKRTLTPEQLEKLKLAREKALEAKTQLKVISTDAKMTKKMERDKKYQEVLAKQQPKETKEEEKPKPEPIKEEPKPKPETKKKKKKKITKIIEITDSEASSDEEANDADDDSSEDEAVKYIVKKKATKKPPRPKQPKQEKSYDINELTPIVARNMLRDKVMSDAQRVAFQSLFPYHQF